MSGSLKRCIAEYLWIDGDGNIRSKTKVCHSINLDDFNTVNYFSEWNYDGSSTKQANGRFSEVIIKPVAIYNDPFRRNVFETTCKLVLCDTYNPDGTPHSTNKRVGACEIFNKNLSLEPKFGIEQEFFLVNSQRIPIGFECGENNELVTSQRAQGDYYCGSGVDNAIGRKCIDKAFYNCLYAGLSLTGMNAEVAPAQWEFQVCTNGISVSDELYVMRYILKRTAESDGMSVTFDPKPLQGEWNGSGCHTNFSTKPMRSDGGKQVIMDAIEKLSQKHLHHMSNYGDGNDRRMTGELETSSYSTFSYGIADRGASIRIPTIVEKEEKGYFEDRRPASNMDPYVVTSLIFQTTSLN